MFVHCTSTALKTHRRSANRSSSWCYARLSQWHPSCLIAFRNFLIASMAKLKGEGALMKKLKLVMVGNGMAGVRTLDELQKIAPDIYDITVFGAEPYANYNRILLSPVLAGDQTINDIMLNDVDWYAENNITLRLGKTISRIDRARRTVGAEDGTEAQYD